MSLISIRQEFPDLKGKLERSEPEINLFIAAQMQTNRGMLFDEEGAYNGHQKWAPLTLRNGQILSRTGALRHSLSPANPSGRPGPGGIVRFQGDVIIIGTKLAYARLMNDGTVNMPGGVLKPVNAKALAIPLPSGKAATPVAKQLRKNSYGQKDLSAKIDQIRAAIATAKGDRLGALQEKLARYEARRNDSPKAERVIFRKSVKIPARPYDQWSAEDEKELEAALVVKVSEVLNR